MGKTIMESLKESFQDVKKFFFALFVIGGLVWIPALFVLCVITVERMVNDTFFVLLLLPMTVLFVLVMSFWFNYFAVDDPVPPLVP
jgi:hypothetical protein